MTMEEYLVITDSHYPECPNYKRFDSYEEALQYYREDRRAEFLVKVLESR
jgi:hypothetical protein